MSKPKGRPPKYTPELCEKLVKYFNVPHTIKTVERFFYKNGDTKEKDVEVANTLPLIQDFCFKNDISKQSFYRWVKQYSDFSDSYNIGKGMQEQMWINNTLKGLYNAPFAIFTGKNMFKWRDKQEIDATIKGEMSMIDLLSKPKQGKEDNKD